MIDVSGIQRPYAACSNADEERERAGRRGDEWEAACVGRDRRLGDVCGVDRPDLALVYTVNRPTDLQSIFTQYGHPCDLWQRVAASRGDAVPYIQCITVLRSATRLAALQLQLRATDPRHGRVSRAVEDHQPPPPSSGRTEERKATGRLRSADPENAEWLAVKWFAVAGHSRNHFCDPCDAKLHLRQTGSVDGGR